MVQKLDFSILWSLHFDAILGSGDQKDYKIGHFRSVKNKNFPPYIPRVSYFWSTKDVKSHIFWFLERGFCLSRQKTIFSTRENTYVNKRERWLVEKTKSIQSNPSGVSVFSRGSKKWNENVNKHFFSSFNQKYITEVVRFFICDRDIFSCRILREELIHA